MTKKMFQVTRAGMVAVTIFICLNLLLDKKVMVGDAMYRTLPSVVTPYT